MRTTVELWRDARETRGRDLFSCSIAEWRFLLEVGQTFGWTPSGTTYDLGPASKLHAAIRNYEPGEASDAKQIDEADAIDWARALDVASRSPHLAAIVEARSAAIDKGPGVAPDALQTLIREFAAYAYGGAFGFKYTPAPDSSHQG